MTGKTIERVDASSEPLAPHYQGMDYGQCMTMVGKMQKVQLSRTDFNEGEVLWQIRI
ncbi:hypothetical protein L0128_03690 [candidate division KSB1 bacterium]|nr:hypothetical protein [candidate division KSB1 bacterium]